MKKSSFLYHILPVSIYICLILLFLLSLSVSRRRPDILSLNPQEVRSGDLMVITGRNFGISRNKSKIWLDQSPLPASAVESWSDTEVKVRVPLLSGSGLLFLETLGGKSKGALYIFSGRVPDHSTGAFLPGQPYLSRINSRRFQPGELVILSGDKLGNRQENSAILVNLTGEAPENVLDHPDEGQYLTVPEEYIYNWTDNSASFFLPENARSGPVYMRTAAGYSNPVTIEVESSGIVETGDARTVSISQKIFIDRVGALPGNHLVLWVPEPADRLGQVLLHSEGDRIPLRYDGNLQVIQLDELASGDEYLVHEQYQVELKNLSYRVNKSQVSAHYDNMAMMDPWLEDEEDIPVSFFTRTAEAVVKRERNPYEKARLLYDYVIWKVSFDQAEAADDYTKWLTEKKMDSFGYASFYTALNRAVGVPARLVSGIWIPENGEKGILHYWTEVYLPGIGWFPIDTAAADGALDSYLTEGSGTPGGWGHLDHGYLSFTRGSQRGFPLSEDSQRIDFRLYSQQNIFEEWIGNLESCSIRWEDIVVRQE